MKKILYISVLFLGASTGLFAQEGFGTSSPDPSSVVDMVANDKGVLLPRVALTEITDATTVPSPADYLTVMNTATAGTGTDAVSPGYYYWLNNQWNAVSASSQEPWNIQATANDATENTQDIYQQGKVAIGFDENDAISDKQFEVKGDIKAEAKHVVASVDYFSGYETGLYSDMVPYSMRYVTKSIPNFESILIGIYEGSSTIQGADFQKTDIRVGNRSATSSLSVTDTGQAFHLSAIGEEGNKDVVIINGNEKGIYLEQRLPDKPKAHVSIKSGQGIQFDYGANDRNYIFPTDNGAEGQVLATDGAAGPDNPAQLYWKDIEEAKAAMPKFFYMPAIIFDTSVQGTELTRDLHAEYKAQFSGTGNPNLVSSAGANPGIPTLPANELEYHITYYDPDVFANLSIDAKGVLTYDIIGTATEASYMNIVFVIKD